MVIHISLGIESYDINIERGILQKARDYLDLNRRVFIVTDNGVPSCYAQRISEQCWYPVIETVPSGERSKSFPVLEQLHKRLMHEGFSRKDCIIAVGGGVVGDLAGFAAATYMRGIDFYNIPTTVLSQVDSSIGGKTAINLDGVKNIVGAFWQPKCVLIDPDTLSTLPERQISNGLAEALKMSLTCDAELFSLFEQNDPVSHLDEIIEKSVNIKRKVVEEDVHEAGIRKVLNFGHTIGHGIECYESSHGLLHGECVALGMIPMCNEVTRQRLISVLEKLNMPVNYSLNIENVYKAMLHDKKAFGEDVEVVFVNEPGTFVMEPMKLSDLKSRISILEA